MTTRIIIRMFSRIITCSSNIRNRCKHDKWQTAVTLETNGCFRKSRYPQIIHFNKIFHYKTIHFWGTPINQLVVSKIFYVHIFTLIVGEMIQVDLPIFFQMGWFNHQLDNIISGQIIATSHDLTPNGGLVREIPLFQGNLGWWNIIIWPDYFPWWRFFSQLVPLQLQACPVVALWWSDATSSSREYLEWSDDQSLWKIWIPNTLPETKSSHLKMDDWKTILSF